MRRKICILTTVALSIRSFYRGQLAALRDAGFEVTVVCAEEAMLREQLPERVRYFPVSFSRVISPFADLVVLWKLFWFFRRERFDIVQYSTPKASLLGAIAAFTARVPIRLYLLWGLYYVGQKGIKYKLLKGFEKVICRLSHRIIPISHEMIDFALSEGLGRKDQYEIILNGSSCGVDLEQCNPERWATSRSQIRNQFELPENGIVIGVVARLTGDKGINELVLAFDKLSEKVAEVYLLLVGTQEEKDRLSSETECIIRDNPRIRLAGWQDNPIPFYTAMDIFCLPTYREGFGEVNLEAQAMSLPVVSTDVMGPRESVEDGVTGFLVPPKSAEAVYEALFKLVSDTSLREQMGAKGRTRVQQRFDRREIINAVVRHRLLLLEKKE
jgi:glycosyltransferase involved in cell wall biosynthesis